jgi:hypothetical protein
VKGATHSILEQQHKSSRTRVGHQATAAQTANTTQEGNPLADNIPQAPAEQGQSEIVLSDVNAHAAYSNFARVTATPEEVIVDFGLNPNPFLAGKQEVHVTQRLIMNFYTAKRLCSALMMTLQRHEATFGSIELDVRRRAQGPQSGTIRP